MLLQSIQRSLQSKNIPNDVYYSLRPIIRVFELKPRHLLWIGERNMFLATGLRKDSRIHFYSLIVIVHSMAYQILDEYPHLPELTSSLHA
jgi:hypothetical protein